jgi:hypothetical protein
LGCGEPGSAVMIIAAARFGLFLMSLLRDSRQTGIVLVE